MKETSLDKYSIAFGVVGIQHVVMKSKQIQNLNCFALLFFYLLGTDSHNKISRIVILQNLNLIAKLIIGEHHLHHTIYVSVNSNVIATNSSTGREMA